VRITSFDDIVGNGIVVSMIKSGLRLGSLHNLLLLKGVHGIGKSSIAELVGKALVCLNPIDGLACGKCEMCVKNEDALLKSGIGVGLTKVNMALVSKEGTVGDEIKDIFRLAKPKGNYVKVLEEFHALRESEQRLFLEETERLPKNVVLILTSTNERKVIKEIQSRCLVFNFSKLSLGESNILVDRVNSKLKLSVRDYEAIYRKTGGIPRDVVLLVKFLSDIGAGKPELASQLGSIDAEEFVAILSLVGDFKEYCVLFGELIRKHDVSEVYWQFKDFVNQMVFAIEGGIHDVLSESDVASLPEMSLETLYRIMTVVESTGKTQIDLEAMFLRIRRMIVGKSYVVDDQKAVARQSTLVGGFVAGSSVETGVGFGGSLTRFSGR
jgi:DNA polymerase III gamma/tau subunit